MGRERTEGHRLSPQQRRLWLLQQQDTSPAYLAAGAFLIEGRLDLLKRNGIWGLLLVLLSLLVFLHWRVAVWVMMGLLLAIAGSFICMRIFGQTLNLITMFGLIVVLGLLVLAAGGLFLNQWRPSAGG